MTMDYLSSGLKMVGVLVLMVGAMGALQLFVRRRLRPGGANSGGRRVKVLESTWLGVKKSVALVQVPGAVLVLGVSGDRISLLDKIPEDRMPLESSRTGGAEPAGLRDTFHRVLDSVLGASATQGGGRP